MIRFAYSFLLVALLSCGASNQAEQNRIKIAFRDSTIQDYTLLAVRENALLVTPYISSYVIKDPQLIPFSKIENVSEDPNITTGGLLLGGLLGCSTGCAIGFGGGGEGYLALTRAIIFAPIGFLTGGIIGCCVSESAGEYNVSANADREKLKKYSKYPDGEPPELQNIK